MRYPGISVLQGDAYSLRRSLSAAGGFLADDEDGNHGLDGIVSSLPLLTRPESVRNLLLEEAFQLLKPGAPFIQFFLRPACSGQTGQGRLCPLLRVGLEKNLPPARVWVYRKGH
ncbi:hypothetical protein QW131_25885 [Roseibium salinum]|nr:hypothetical protein [Roseibium salinum]